MYKGYPIAPIHWALFRKRWKKCVFFVYWLIQTGRKWIIALNGQKVAITGFGTW